MLNNKRLPKLTILIFIMTLLHTFTVNAHDTQESDQQYTEPISMDLFENHGSIMLIIDTETGLIVEANTAALNFYGYSRDELMKIKISDINVLTSEEVSKEMSDATTEKRNFFVFKHRQQSGAIRDVEVYSYPFESNNTTYLYSIIIDITDQLIAEKNYRNAVNEHYFISGSFIVLLLVVSLFLLRSLKRGRKVQTLLKKTEEGYEELFDNMHEGYALHEMILDDLGNPVDYRFLQVNKSFEVFTGLNSNNLIGQTVLDVMPNTEKYWIDAYGKVALNGDKLTIENYAKDLNRHYSVNAYNAGPRRFITVFVDTTDNKEKESEIDYLNYHDQLTGLYNRRYMEKALTDVDVPANLPLSIIMADVNGLKLTNDAFGHSMGDDLLTSTAKTFRSIFRDDDIIARVGGDEFLIILLNTSREVSLAMTKRLYEYTRHILVGPIKLSVSLGSATKNSVTEEIQTIYKRAEDRMYHNKLTESHETRRLMIQHLFGLIKDDYPVIDQHQNRVGQIAAELQDLYALSDSDHKKLVQASNYHDVGLIAIDTNIANKPGILDDNEWHEVKRHSECGFRILSAISEFAEIADLILAHHEWFDGSGYPKNLRGNEIPYLSRIISIIDAYDAMTHDRLYRKVYSKDEAILELRHNSGTQFDPELLETFITEYLNKL